MGKVKKSRKAANARFIKRRDEAIAEGRVAPAVQIVAAATHLVEQVFTVKYICGHQNRFIDPAPHPNDVLWCYRCCDYQTVIKVDQSVIKRRLRGSDDAP